MSDKHTSQVAAPESQAQKDDTNEVAAKAKATDDIKEVAPHSEITAEAAKLDAATHDLYYPSESDEPVKPVIWPVQVEAVTAEQVRQQAGLDAAAPVKEISPDEFFERVLKTEDWYGEEENAIVQRFTELKELLEKDLREVKAFRFGRVEVDVYLVGLDKANNLAGIATKVVET